MNPVNAIDPQGLESWYDDFKIWEPNSTLGRQFLSIGQGMGGIVALALGERGAANLAFIESASNSGYAILNESCASNIEYGAYYSALGVSGVAATGALLGGVAEMAGLISTIPQGNNIIRIISKTGRWGIRLDKAHHGKGWGHPHFWRW